MSESISNDNVKRLLAFLKETNDKIDLSTYHNVVLIIGNTGSGKSTLARFLGGNNNHLVSIETCANSGEFIITDIHNKISQNATIISKTTHPEVVVDDRTETVFIDCPGFDDSRNEAYDIADAYCIRKVIQSVKNIKIVLTTSYPSVREGVSRNDFLQLLKHVTILLKDITKYCGSVALIVTKIDNQVIKTKEGYVLVTDTSVIENIAKFLGNVKQSMETRRNLDQVYVSALQQHENEVFYRNSKQLLELLLHNDTTGYPRLGIFRRPDATGQLSQIELLQKGKKSLDTMLGHLKYSPVAVDDIGYAISDKSKNLIEEFFHELNQNIVADMAHVNNVVIEYCKHLESKFFHHDMHILLYNLITVSAKLSEINNIPESASPKELVRLLETHLMEPCRHASESALRDISYLDDFLNFLQHVNDKPFGSSAWKWTNQLRTAVAHVKNSVKWYEFLKMLYERLCEYDIQKDPDVYTIPKFQIRDGPIENNREFMKFLNRIQNLTISKFLYLNDFPSVIVDDEKISYFHRIIDSTLKCTPKYTEKNHVFQVLGEFVKLSDVIKYWPCKWTTPVQIFATHTFFVDADLHTVNDVSIIAPRWHILRDSKISINTSRADTLLSTGFGFSKQTHHFFRIGTEFKNGEKLEVKLKSKAEGVEDTTEDEEGEAIAILGTPANPLKAVRSLDTASHNAVSNYYYKLRKQITDEDIPYPTSDTITYFRNELLGDLYDCVKKPSSLQFYMQLQNEKFLQHDTTDLILLELEQLETHCNKFAPDVKTLLYRLIEKRIEKVSKSLDISNTNQHQLLASMALIVTTKIAGIDTKLQYPLVSDRHAYFDQWKTANGDVNKIREFSFHTSSDVINNAIDYIRIIDRDIFDDIEDLIANIVGSTRQTNDQQSYLIRLKIYSTLKIIGKFLLLSATLAKANLALANNREIRRILPSMDIFENPIIEPSVETSLDAFEDHILDRVNSVIQAISKEAGSLQLLGDEFRQIVDILRNHEVELRSSKTALKKQYNTAHCDDVIRSIAQANSAYQTPHTRYTALMAINRFDKEMKLAKFDVELCNFCGRHNIDCDIILPSIDRIQNVSSRLDEFGDHLLDIIVPILKAVKDSLTKDGYKPKDAEALRTNILNILKFHVSSMKQFEQFGIDDDLHTTIDNFKVALNRLIFIYNSILPSEGYVGLIGTFSTYLENQTDLDPSIKQYFLKVINADVLFHEYHSLTDAFLKYVAPFDKLIRANFSTPRIPFVHRYSDQHKTTVAANVDLLQHKLRVIDQSAQKYISQDDFSSHSQTGAFFTWRNESHKKSISRLLRGKEVILPSHNMDTTKEHLKFHTIRLRLQIEDTTTQKKFQNELKNFNVIMTHTGSSYFNTDKQLQLLHQDSVRFLYNPNEAAAKVYSEVDAKNSPELSPYTTWIFNLVPVNETATFDLLQPYLKSPVHLLLEGYAKYISSETRIKCQDTNRNAHNFDRGPSPENISYADNIVEKYLLTKKQRHH